MAKRGLGMEKDLDPHRKRNLEVTLIVLGVFLRNHSANIAISAFLGGFDEQGVVKVARGLFF